MKVLNWDLN
ncbi:hypothetical protein VCHENC02_2691A, partial [Vibrio harveyi]